MKRTLKKTRKLTPRDSAAEPAGVITLLKGNHRWRFRFSPGQECEVFAAAAALAERPSSGLDHFDLAILAYRLGLQAGARRHPPTAE